MYEDGFTRLDVRHKVQQLKRRQPRLRIMHDV